MKTLQNALILSILFIALIGTSNAQSKEQSISSNNDKIQQKSLFSMVRQNGLATVPTKSRSVIEILHSSIGRPSMQSVTGSGSAGQVTFWTGTSTISGDSNLNWDNTNKRLGVKISTPVAVLQAMYDSNAALYNEPAQGNHGANARVFAIADGSTTTPTSTTAPSLVARRVDSSAGSIPYAFAMTKTSGGGFTYMLHGLAKVLVECSKSFDIN